MTKRVLVRALLIVGLLVAVSGGQALAGGPVCPPPACPPPVCAPPMMCPPPMSVCGPAPVCGPPPVCGPRPMCGPPPCPPPKCKENPLAQIVRGACDVVVGVVALPFRAVDCLVDLARRPKCGPPPCGPMAMCPPPHVSPPDVWTAGLRPARRRIRDGSGKAHGIWLWWSPNQEEIRPVRQERLCGGQIDCRIG